jgi:hypothetical protein
MLRRKYPAETASFIENGIRPLVVALSRWGFEVCYSCEGHPRKKDYPLPYVAFTLDSEYLGWAEFSDLDLRKVLKDIRKKLRGTGWGIFHKDEWGVLRAGELVGYVIRPYKRNSLTLSAGELAERIRPLKPKFCGWVYHNE